MKQSHSKLPPSVARVVGEIREQPGPELDWDSLERELMSDLERGRQPRYAPRSRWPGVWTGLSLAAAALLLLVVWRDFQTPKPTESEATVASEDSAPRTLLGSDLEVGQRLSTGAHAVAVEHPGLGTWVLEPRSSGEVRSNDEKVVVQLQSGGLHAKIVPSARPETFVVEVGRVRVAVHGTEFSVRRDANQAYVEVSEGVVAVSSPGQSGQTLLEAPASGRFYLAGKDAGRTLEARGQVHPVQPVEQARPAKVAVAQKKLPNEPTFSDVEAGLAEVEKALKQCLRDSTNTIGKVRVSLQTRVTLRIEGDGTISRYAFAPPLAPGLEDCAQKRLSSVRFAASVSGAHVIRDLLIELQ